MSTAAPADRRHARRPLLGPHAHGRRFRWDQYIEAVESGNYVEGCRFELGRGVLFVEGFNMAEVANPWHAYVIYRVRKLLTAWDLAHPDRVELIAGGSETRVVVPITESDRHPDVALYSTAPPADDSRAWWSWPPELAVEVVSPGSSVRDHEEKPPEYLAYGVGEYWVLDADHPDRRGPSAHVFVREPDGEGGERWKDRWEDEVVTSDRFPGLRVPVADVLAPLPGPAEGGTGEAA